MKDVIVKSARTKKKNNEPAENINTTSMSYYKKIKRPQSALLVENSPSKQRLKQTKTQFNQDGFANHVKGLAKGSDLDRISKLAKKRLSREITQTYDLDTVLSNRSSGMNLKQLFSAQSMK